MFGGNREVFRGGILAHSKSVLFCIVLLRIKGRDGGISGVDYEHGDCSGEVGLCFVIGKLFKNQGSRALFPTRPEQI